MSDTPAWAPQGPAGPRTVKGTQHQETQRILTELEAFFGSQPLEWSRRALALPGDLLCLVGWLAG